MRYQFSIRQACLRAEMRDRETVEETLAFVRALAEEARKAQLPRIAVVVRRSRPIFRVEQYRLSEYFRELTDTRGVRLALVSDSSEVHAAHEYIEVLARLKGAEVRAFREEPAAFDWLTSQVHSQEKR